MSITEPSVGAFVREGDVGKRAGGTEQVSLRLPADVVAGVDRYVRKLRKGLPSRVEITRTSAIVALLEQALEAQGVLRPDDDADNP